MNTFINRGEGIYSLTFKNENVPQPRDFFKTENVVTDTLLT